MTSFRFRRSDRIVREEDFARALRHGRLVSTPHVRVRARENGLGRSRLGVSVGRKFGKAVIRNRFKRLVREAFRTSPEVRSAGLDIVVMTRDPGVLDRPGEIAEALTLAVSRPGADPLRRGAP